MVFLLLMAALAGEPAAAQPHVIVNPDWLSRPSGEDLTELYPKSAAARHIEGSATISCTISAAGELVGCRTIQETPAGEGFGDAALAMSGKFKMRPMTRDGVPVASGVVNIPIRFVLPKLALSAETVLHCYGYAAVAAEKNPSSDQAQTGVFMWRMFAEATAVKEKLRPSEIDARLTAAREFAGRAGASRDEEREQCERAAAPFTASTTSLLDNLPR